MKNSLWLMGALGQHGTQVNFPDIAPGSHSAEADLAAYYFCTT